MVYFAAGVSGLTSVVGAFFLKDYLDLSASFVAGLAFWAGLPWVMKMPMGHVVDLFWRWKGLLILLGAGLIATALLIMYGLVARPDVMRPIMEPETWFIVALILSPTGYAIQDVVADAMTVEAVPKVDAHGQPIGEEEARSQHTTMQTLGRIAIISGFAAVAAVNIWVFTDTEALPAQARLALYARIYLIALVIPAISVSGMVLHGVIQRRQRLIRPASAEPERETEVNWQILGGGLAFVVLSVGLGGSGFTYAPEMIFVLSMAVIAFLINRLLKELDPEKAKILVGTAIIIFVFRAIPLPGPGLTWFEIDELGFDQQFLSVLSLIASMITLVAMVVLRPMMAKRSIAFVVVILTLAGGLLSLPNIGLYFGIHEWTAAHTGGVVDARFIAIFDTALESPLVQIAMIPMLAWIAKNAPPHLKATFFAVMASFTNLALSASSLGTKYINQIFTVTREVRDRITNEIDSIADYDELGMLLITVALIGVLAPLITVYLVQRSPLRTHQ